MRSIPKTTAKVIRTRQNKGHVNADELIIIAESATLTMAHAKIDGLLRF